MLKDHYDYEPYPKYDGVVTDYMLGRTTKEGKMRYKVEKEISLLTIAQAGPKGCDEFAREFFALDSYLGHHSVSGVKYYQSEPDFKRTVLYSWAEQQPKRIDWLIEKGFLSRVEELKPCPFCGSKKLEVCYTVDYEERLVSCNDCDADGPMCSTREMAIEAWNRRAE